MTVHLYDGMNVVRMKLENDPSGRVPRSIVLEQLSMSPDDIAVWVWDGPGGKSRRQDLYPNYKAKRSPQPDGVWETITFIRDLLKHTPAMQVMVRGFEADDVIAHYTQIARPDVLIHSSDRDFAQLGVRGTWKDLKVPSDLVRLYKTWVGDPSDNISGVPGFGQKSWEETDKYLLEKITARAVAGHEIDHFVGDFAPRVRNWLAENAHQLAVLWKITGFFPVSPQPSDVIVGKRNQAAAFSQLERFMQ